MKTNFKLPSNMTSEQIINFLLHLTGNEYEIVLAHAYYFTQADPENLVIDNNLYQIKSKNVSDSFFNWYCYVRRDHQYFADKSECLRIFHKYYTIWISEGKPDWKKELAEELNTKTKL